MNTLFKNEKYEATGETIDLFDTTLYRIRAVKAFKKVNAGDIGGWISGPHNLSIIDDAWVADNAKVYGDAKIYGYARVFGNAVIADNAQVYGSALVFGDAQIFGNALVFGSAEISDNAEVSGWSNVFGCTKLYGDARIGWSGNYLTISPIGFIEDGMTAYTTSSGHIEVVVDGLIKTLEDFEKIIELYHSNDGYLLIYNAAINLIKAQLLR